MSALAAEGFVAEIPASPVLFATIAGRRARFCLPHGQIGDLETLCGEGIEEIMARFARVACRRATIIEPIRLGLIGGGECTAATAQSVVDTFVAPALADYRQLAERIVTAAFAGIDLMPDQPGEAEGPDAGPAI